MRQKREEHRRAQRAKEQAKMQTLFPDAHLDADDDEEEVARPTHPTPYTLHPTPYTTHTVCPPQRGVTSFAHYSE